MVLRVPFKGRLFKWKRAHSFMKEKQKKSMQQMMKSVVWVEYKDSATAFNGEKKAEIAGKGRLNNEITSLIFERLKEKGIESHFIEQISETEQLVKKVTIIPLETVVRNIAAGNFSKRLGIEEGTLLSRPIVEFYYKNDVLGRSVINR